MSLDRRRFLYQSAAATAVSALAPAVARLSALGLPGAAPLHVNGARLNAALAAFDRIGRTPTGINRVAYSEADLAGRAFMANHFKESGLTLRLDALGNMIARVPGTLAGAAPLLIGSHVDSVTDGGKMVRLCLQNNVTTIDGFDALRAVTRADGTRTVPKFEGPKIGQIAVPTTLAGGEFNNQAGCTDLRVQIKHGYRHADLMPRTVVLDPAPSVHAPLRVWLSTGMRAVDHAVEGICSQFAHPGGDASFIHALKLLSRGLRAVKHEPGNLEARLDCAMGVWLSMAGRQGRAQMGASHALGHVLGGSYEVPQGDASSIVLPHVLRFNRAANAAQQRTVAEAMGHADQDAADVVAALARDIGTPSTLKEVGIVRAQFAAIADHAMHESWMQSNPRPITDAAQIMDILNAAE